MIDNFNIMQEFMSFSSDDEFYFVQVLMRKKDNPEGRFGSNNSSRLIKAYYIKSIEQLFKQKDEMIALSRLFNARVGINLNKRSFYKTGFNMLKKLAESMHNKEFSSLHRAYNTVCGIHNSMDDKIWLIDIDWKDGYKEGDVLKIADYIDSECMPKGQKVTGRILTPNGVHLLTRGFDLRNFNTIFPKIEIHKNNPTILYVPDPSILYTP